MSESWSEELTSLSQETLEDMLDGGFPGARCILKKKTGDEKIYGFISNGLELLQRKAGEPIVVISKDDDRRWSYSTVDEILADGWAVD